MKIEKLEYYSSSRDGYTFESRPNRNDIVDKLNEIIDKLNEKDDDQSVEHGTWIKIGIFENRWLVYRCSLCGEQTLDNSAYCPNCGVKMREEVKK